MALSKKSSREIYVDGDTYRWVFSPDSGFFYVVVQSAIGDGARLEAQSSSDWIDFGDAHISSRDVARLIRLALKDGWSPSINGPPFRVQDFDRRLNIRPTEAERTPK